MGKKKHRLPNVSGDRGPQLVQTVQQSAVVLRAGPRHGAEPEGTADHRLELDPDQRQGTAGHRAPTAPGQAAPAVGRADQRTDAARALHAAQR